MSRAAVAARTVLPLAAAALTLALGAAGLATWQATAANRYWAAGFHRLLAAEVWARWDAAAPTALAAALVLAVGVALAGRKGPGRRAVAAAAVLLALLASLRAATTLEARRAARGPNLLLISIDTLRADRLGAYGCTLPTSPTLDARLVAAGVTFERVFSQSPKTTPSHMTMLTSLYPSVHGVELWDATGPKHALGPQVRTLAEVLRNAGYATAAFTGGAHLERVWGFGRGFETYEECNGEELGRARRWLRHQGGRRFFLFFHTYQVHDPYLPPLATADLFDPEYRGPIREVVRRLRHDPAIWADAHRLFWDSVDANDPRAARFVARLYDAGIRHMDGTTLAPLLDQLAAQGLENDTLVVFTSDHGEAFLEHGVFLHDDLHAETLHVPLVLRLPGALPAGRRVAAPARLLDLMPTVLELLGVPAPAELQGRSLAALARGATAAAPAPDIVSEYSDRARARVFESLRRDGSTYIVRGGSETLFEDAAERSDLAAARPDLLAALRAELADWRAACGALAARLGPAGPAVEPRDENVRRLRALGYVQ